MWFSIGAGDAPGDQISREIGLGGSETKEKAKTTDSAPMHNIGAMGRGRKTLLTGLCQLKQPMVTVLKLESETLCLIFKSLKLLPSAPSPG
ncbi:hypothetical protein C8029_10955 [Roseobacter sp. TSBP12]|nr:hypothetical protein C8029_10955 [Roseobacter sp. TSBP12]